MAVAETAFFASARLFRLCSEVFSARLHRVKM